MQTIDRRWGTEQPEPGDSGFWQIVDGIQQETVRDKLDYLAYWGSMASNEALRSLHELGAYGGGVAITGAPEPLVVKIIERAA